MQAEAGLAGALPEVACGGERVTLLLLLLVCASHSASRDLPASSAARTRSSLARIVAKAAMVVFDLMLSPLALSSASSSALSAA